MIATVGFEMMHEADIRSPEEVRHASFEVASRIVEKPARAIPYHNEG